MKATFLYGHRRRPVETVPDPVIKQPTDAIVRIVRTCVCGSDLHGGWYGNTETGGLQAELARIPQANGSLVKVPDVDPNTADEALLASYSPSPTST